MSSAENDTERCITGTIELCRIKGKNIINFLRSWSVLSDV